MEMKRILLPLIVMLFTAIQLVAQIPDRGRPKFDPKAFEMKMEHTERSHASRAFEKP